MHVLLAKLLGVISNEQEPVPIFAIGHFYLARSASGARARYRRAFRTQSSWSPQRINLKSAVTSGNHAILSECE
jgi:hypothetical protein